MSLLRRALAAIGRGRIAIATVAATYALSVTLGIVLSTAGAPFAVAQRDAVVSDAQSGAILSAYSSGDRLRAALLDFAANLVLGGVTSTLAGMSVVIAYPIAASRGWVGGIVSIDAQHRSRLAEPRRATYYLVTLILQLIPYSIAGGMGVYVGIGAWKALLRRTSSWLGLPTGRLRDAALAYVVVAPLFLVASLFEFLA